MAWRRPSGSARSSGMRPAGHGAGHNAKMNWGDRVGLGSASFSLIIPFLFAYDAKVSLPAPIPYVISLGLVLIFVRRWMPFKAVGIFCSFIILLLSIEAGDGIINDQTADYLRLSRTLKMEELSPEEIKFYLVPCATEHVAPSAITTTG